MELLFHVVGKPAGPVLFLLRLWLLVALLSSPNLSAILGYVTTSLLYG